MTEKMEAAAVKIVAELPDLMRPEDYMNAVKAKKVRFRLTLNDEGLEVLGDSLYIESLENLFSGVIRKQPLERSLCG